MISALQTQAAVAWEGHSLPPTHRAKAYDPRKAGALCDKCPLNGSKVVPPFGPLDADLVLVAETPGEWEERKGQPLVGPSGATLDEMLYRLGIRRNRVWTSNVIQCRPDTKIPGRDRFSFQKYLAQIRKSNAAAKRAHAQATKTVPKEFRQAWAQSNPLVLTPTPIECCRPRLQAELSYFESIALNRGQPNGASVLALGNFALEELTRKKGVMKYRGSPLMGTILTEGTSGDASKGVGSEALGSPGQEPSR